MNIIYLRSRGENRPGPPTELALKFFQDSRSGLKHFNTRRCLPIFFRVQSDGVYVFYALTLFSLHLLAPFTRVRVFLFRCGCLQHTQPRGFTNV